MFRVRGFPPASIVACCLLVLGGPAVGQPQANRASEGYALAPDDTIMVRVPDSEEFAQEKAAFRIDNQGFVNLPLVGRYRAAGRTVGQLESELTEKLKKHYLAPRVSVSVSEIHSEQVSVLGAVTTAGVQRGTGRDTLVEAISRAGGLRQDAGRTVTVTRRLQYGRIPLPEAKDDPTGQFSIAELALAPIMSGERPAANIFLEPHDVVTVARAQMIYVLGEVTRSGGYVINEKAEMSVLKALAMAGGLARTAKPSAARVLRVVPGSTERQDIPVNVSKMVKNNVPDLALGPEDILYVPGDLAKKVATRTIEAAIGVGSNVAIWRVAQ